MEQYDFLLFNMKFDHTSITYSYDHTYSLWNGLSPSQAIEYFDDSTKVSFTSSTEKNYINYAFALWENYSALSFTPTAGLGDINIYKADMQVSVSGVAAQLDSNTSTQTASYFVDGNYNRAEIALYDDISITGYGGFDFYLVLHEIGHSLGLSHPNGDGDDTNFYSTMTVMSYRIDSGHYAITPMAMDVAALVQHYGAFTYNSGSGDIYDENTLLITGIDTAQTIVDTGGANDEINLSGISGSHIIDLREALDDSGVWLGHKTIVNSKEWIYIANDTIIENATGGSGNDTITGNDADNILKGEGGDDIFYGSAGNDSFYGGTTDETSGDTVDYSAFTGFMKFTVLDVEASNYKVEKWNVGSDPTSDPADGTDMLYSIENPPFASIDPGAGEFDEQGAYGTGDTINGDANNNNLGPAGGETEGITVNGMGGDDSIDGHNGYDDLLSGGTGDDFIQGWNGNDKLLGGDDDDTLQGMNGDDWLDGGAGDDMLQGGQGDDLYILSGGNDTINEYGGGLSNGDTVRFQSGVELADLTFSRTGNSSDVIVYIDGGETITLKNHNHSLSAHVDWLDLDDGMHNMADILVPVYGTSANENIKGSTSLLDNGVHYRAASSIHDLIYGGAGDDNIDAYHGNNIVYGGSGDDDIQGGWDSDLLYGEADDDDIHGDRGNDFLYGGAGNDELLGDYGADALYGGDGDDQLIGLYDNDYLDGGAGNDILEGGSGDDTYYYSSGNDIFEESHGTDVIMMTAGITLDDLSFDKNGNDMNITIAGAGSVELSNYYYSNAYKFETILFANESTFDLSEVSVNIVGTASAENLYGNNNLNDIIYADGGNDTLYGYSGNDMLYGEAGNDTLHGGNDNDILSGGAGADILRGNQGDDTLIYESGMDTFYEQSSGNDTIWITNGISIEDISFADIGSRDTSIIVTASTDEIFLDNQRYSSAYQFENLSFDDGFETNLLTDYTNWDWGTTGADTLNGDSNDNMIIGNDGNDSISAGDGNDDIHGGAGDDTIHGGVGNDLIYGGEGIDTATFTQSVYVDLYAGTASGEESSDILMAIENITGSAYADFIAGDNNDNVIQGGDGDDYLTGGAGEDTLSGGGDADIFVAYAGDLGYDIDVIMDFDTLEGDAIDIADLLTLYDPLADTLADFVEITDNGTDSSLSVDVDGGGNSFVQILEMTGVTGLTDEAALVTSGNLIV